VRVAALSCAALLCCGCAELTVARSVDGQVVEGRFISPRAYTLYAIGAEAEAHGDLQTALEAYEQAEESDPESPDIWTRIGAVRCRLGGEHAPEAFDRARALTPDYEPAWREQARCDLAANRLASALARVEHAVLLDPDRDDGSLLRAEILRKLGRTDEARLALRALTTRHPRSVDAWHALYAFSLQVNDMRAAEQAARRVRELVPRQGDALQRRLPSMLPLAELDEALMAGQLQRARRLAQEAHVPPAEVAVRAAALGRMHEARDQGELVTGADPSSASALVALALAADLSGDEEALSGACEALLASGPGRIAPLVAPSSLARLLLAELLARRVGRDAAVTWLGTPSPAAASAHDPLEQRVAKRVQQQLGAAR
jgi:tetratricopeptide (TPR) repeat protein